MKLKQFPPSVNTKTLFFQFWVMMTVLIFSSLALAACNEPEPEPEDLIRGYIYENQPVTDEAFMEWAGKNLSQFSSRRVYEAIYTEAQSQAEQGHPTATGVLQALAKEWARAKGLSFNVEDWRDLQKEALENVESSPTLRGLWPKE